MWSAGRCPRGAPPCRCLIEACCVRPPHRPPPLRCGTLRPARIWRQQEPGGLGSHLACTCGVRPELHRPLRVSVPALVWLTGGAPGAEVLSQGHLCGLGEWLSSRSRPSVDVCLRERPMRVLRRGRSSPPVCGHKEGLPTPAAPRVSSQGVRPPSCSGPRVIPVWCR